MAKHYERTNAARKAHVRKKVPRGRAATKAAKKSMIKECLVGKRRCEKKDERWTGLEDFPGEA